MKKLGLTSRITLVFVLFAALLLLGVGLLSYRSGSTALQAAVVSELLSTALSKEAQLDEWVEDQIVNLETLAASPTLASALATHASAPAGSEQARAALERMEGELKPRTSGAKFSRFLLLALVDPESGHFIATSGPKIKMQTVADQPFFLKGRQGSYVEYPYYSELLRAPAITIGTPLRSAQGQLLGVLVGWLNIAELEQVTQPRSGLHYSDETYLVNPAKQFVTRPRFLEQTAVLQTHTYSEAVKACLAGNSGVTFARDYRGVPTIAVYRWLPKHKLGLISKMDEEEALEPIRAFGKTILLISILVLASSSLVALYLARTIIRPVRAQRAGVARFGRGELHVRLPVNSPDALGELADEFNRMAEAVAEKEAQLRASASELEARVAERTHELKASEERTRAIIGSAHDAFVGMDATGLITDWNHQAEMIFGWLCAEAIGQPMHELLIPLRYREQHLRGLKNFLASGEGPVLNKRLELAALHRLGHELPVEITISPIRFGGSVMFGAFLRDITQRKQAEHELQRAKESAEAASLAKSEFLANMSHEIRTPMNGVLGTIGLLLDSPLSMEQRELAELAQVSGESLLGIIDDILDFSKVEAGKLTLEPLLFDLLSVIEETAELVATKAQEKHLEVIVRYPPQVPRQVIGDQGRIRQVLTNLATNAVKFTERGHVLIEIEILAQSITELSLRISIQDTGIGVPPHKLDRLFEKFTQADASTTRRYGGTGLGLAISKQLVELMGGNIGAQSLAGEGSSFWFTLRLPYQQETVEPLLVPDELTGTRVLIVDDNAINRRALHELLSAWQMHAAACASGEDALPLLREAQAAGEPYAIAILDYRMPEMDGEMLGSAIKEDAALRDTQLVMLTTQGQRGDVERLKTLGFAAYLNKPVRQADLRAALVNVRAAYARRQRSNAMVTRHSLAEARALQSTRREKRPQFNAHVLLAEDNPTNQMVAALMLRGLGCHVEIANDGREAVNMLEADTFDLVFMDCEMPEMNGFEATEEIRRRGNGNAHVPILALTAQAMQGDRERCLEVGMNDYLTKPVRVDAFVASLQQWLPPGSQQEPKAAQDEPEEPVRAVPPPPAAPDRLAVLDAEAIARLRLLAASTDDDVLQRIFQAFQSDSAQRIKAIRTALDAGEAQALAQAAYMLSGACMSIGARRMAPIAQQIEKLGVSGALAGVSPLVDRLEQEFVRVMAVIGELSPGVQQANPAA